MDLSRLTMYLCVFLLAVCLALSVCTLTVLRNAVSETDRVRGDAQELLENFQEHLQLQQGDKDAATEPPESSVPVDILYDSFCMREDNGRIGIYTGDGYLVRLLDVQVEALPENDRLALRAGISVSSWKEVLALIQDYGG